MRERESQREGAVGEGGTLSTKKENRSYSASGPKGLLLTSVSEKPAQLPSTSSPCSSKGPRSIFHTAPVGIMLVTTSSWAAIGGWSADINDFVLFFILPCAMRC